MADLSVTNVVSIASINVGNSTFFSVTVRNNGPETATSVTAQDSLPAGMVFVSASTSTGTFYDSSTGVWTIGSLVNGAAVALTLLAKATTFGTKVNVASVSHASDSNPANDIATATIVVNARLAAIAEDSGARLITQADLLANASDPDDPSLTASNLAIATGLGSLVNNNNGTWSYTPALNDDTSVSFSYQVADSITAPVATSRRSMTRR